MTLRRWTMPWRGAMWTILLASMLTFAAGCSLKPVVIIEPERIVKIDEHTYQVSDGWLKLRYEEQRLLLKDLELCRATKR